MVRLCELIILAALVASPALGAEPTAPADKKLAEQVRKLIAQLGDNDYYVRERATSALKDIGRPALDALEAATKSTDPEVARRAEIAADFVRHLPRRDPSKVKKDATNGYMAVWTETGQVQTFKLDADTAIDCIRFRAARTAGITGTLDVELREFGKENAQPLVSGHVPFEWTDEKGKVRGVTCYFDWFEVKGEARLKKGTTYALVFSSKTSPAGGRWLINCFYRDAFPGGKALRERSGETKSLGDYDLAIELKMKDKVVLTTVPKKTVFRKLEGFGVGHDGEILRTPETPPQNPQPAQ